MTDCSFSILPDRGLLRLTGDEVTAFLQGLVTNNVDGIGEGDAVYASLLTPQGKILFDFFIIGQPDGVLIDCAREQAPDLRKRLMFYRLRAAIEIDDLSETHCVAALWGEDCPESLNVDVVRFQDPRVPDLGIRIIAEVEGTGRTLENLEANRVTPDVYLSHRLSLGVAEGGNDFESGTLFPHDANLDQLSGIDFHKGCYVGQEVVSRMYHKTTARKRILPVTVSGELDPDEVDIVAGDRSVGTLLSRTGDAGVAVIRLDRLQTAIDGDIPVTVGKQAAAVNKPDWATFDVPEAKSTS